MNPHQRPERPTRLAACIAMAFPILAMAQTSIAPAASAEQPASAPNAPDAQDVERLAEQVIVRARGRDETAQSVPISQKVFSAKTITDAGIKKPADFVALTPNLSMVETESAGVSFMTIRGLTQVRNGDAPMAVVVDGVQQVNSSQFTQDLFDIQTIEVLRGPQGALYGRNASGGAILIRTKQPTNDTEGFISPFVASGNERGVTGAVSGSLVKDTLFFRLAGSYKDRGGDMINEVLGKRVDWVRDRSIRSQLKWNATDDLTVDLRLSRLRTTDGALNFQYQPAVLNPDCTTTPTLDGLFGGSVDANRVTRRFCANNYGIDHRNVDEVTVKTDYETDFATFSAVYSNTKLKVYNFGDAFPYSASITEFDFFTDQGQGLYENVKANSLELRLTSPTRPGLRWSAGMYGLSTKRYASVYTANDLGLGIEQLFTDPQPNSAISPTTVWFASNNDNKASAVFGNIDYDLTPKVEASLAWRYDRDKRNQLVDYRQFNGSADIPYGLPSPNCTANNPEACTKRATYSEMQPKFSMRYKADDGSIVYSSVGRGFRSGQFNQSGVAASASDAGVAGVKDEVPAEITDSAELGYKTILAGGTVQLNAALFATRVRNAPFFVFIGQTGAQVLVPIDDIRLVGGELEAVAKLSNNLDLYSGLGITQSKIERFTLNPTAVGNWAPYIPKISANAGSQYRFPVTPSVRGLFRTDVQLKGKQYWDAENSTPRNTLVLVNMRTSLEGPKGKWSASLAVNNLLDKAYNAEYVQGGFTWPAPRRKFSADYRWNF